MTNLHKRWLRRTAPVVVFAGILSLGSRAAANTITLTDVSQAGAGPYTYTYTVTYSTSLLLAGDFFTINDFGPAAVGVFPLPPGYAFSQSASGPNSIPAGPLDDASILNATFTWMGPPTTPVPGIGFAFSLISAYAPGLLDYYSSADHIPGTGAPSVVAGFVTVPFAPPPVPEAGSTMAFLGLALLVIGVITRKALI